MRGKLTRGLIHIGQISMSVAPARRCADSDEYQVGLADPAFATALVLALVLADFRV